jgi:tRNA 2-thiouridine synthesizing protein E
MSEPIRAKSPSTRTRQTSAPIACDADGFLLDTAQWNPAFATASACADGVTLTPEHWEIIEFVREFYAQFHMSPPMRLLSKAITAKLGAEKGKSLYLYQLFPDGPAKQASKFAGLPKPVSCI